MKPISHYLRVVKDFLNRGIWLLDPEKLSQKDSRLLQTGRVALYSVRKLNDNNISLLSVSLCYFCTMAVVPFLAVCLALTGGFDLNDKLQALLQTWFNEDNQILDWLIRAADNIVATAQSGLFGLVSALLFFWLVIWMMDRVEKVFNEVWEIKEKRNRLKSYGIDLAILILSPFIILVFFSGSVVYSHMLDYVIPGSIGISEHIKSLVGWLIFGASSVGIFSAMFKFIPNTKVRYRYALRAALISGIAFTVLQYLYLETQLMVTRVNAVYGTVAAIPLFMLWLRYGWLIIIIGAQLSCSFQQVAEHPETLPAELGIQQ